MTASKNYDGSGTTSEITADNENLHKQSYLYLTTGTVTGTTT